MIQVYCEYLSVRYIWLYVIIMSRTSFRVDIYYIVCLNDKELLARRNRRIRTLSDNIEIEIHKHLVRKRKFNYLAKLAKWFSRVVITYTYGAFDFMILLCHVRISE